MQINITFDSSVSGAPAGFVAGVNDAVAYLESVFTNSITINIDVGYGEVNGQTLSRGALGESINFFDNFTYTQVRNAFLSVASSPDQLAAASTLPSTDPTGGATFEVATAEEKALGLLDPNSSAVDGYVGFSKTASFTFDPNNRSVAGEYDFIGVVEHEITEVMGRISPNGDFSLMDMFRYSGPGTRDLTQTPPPGFNNASYFSIDGGTTDLGDWNNPTISQGDLGDWAPSMPPDAFLATVPSGQENPVTAVDIRLMNVLGYSIGPVTPPAPMAKSDFNDDSKSDILWSNSVTGAVAVWEMNGFQIANSATVTTQSTNWHNAGVADFNGDSKSDVLWTNPTTGEVAIWEMNGLLVTSSSDIATIASPNWKVAGTGDFNADGKADILWSNTSTGEIAIWQMNGLQITNSSDIATIASPNWKIAGTGDFNSDGKTDILWDNTATGEVAIWEMNGFQIASSSNIATVGSSNWQIAGTGDFNGDGKTDILWDNSATGEVAVWEMNGFQVTSSSNIATVGSSNWKIAGTGDYNGDGSTDILWSNTATGETAIWEMNGFQILNSSNVTTVSTNWHILGNPSSAQSQSASASLAAPEAGGTASMASTAPLGTDLFNKQAGHLAFLASS